MKNEIKQGYKYKVPGYDNFYLLLALPSTLILYSLLAAVLFVSLEIWILRVLLIILLYFFCKKIFTTTIMNLYFYEDELVVKYISQSTRTIKYSDIESIIYVRKLMFNFYNYEFRFFDKKNKNITHFYRNDVDIIDLENFLKEKNINIR